MPISTDIGGTFTDFVIFDGGTIKTFKAPSTPQKPELAIEKGLLRCARTTLFSHGTPLATNAVLGLSYPLQVEKYELITGSGGGGKFSGGLGIRRAIKVLINNATLSLPYRNGENTRRRACVVARMGEQGRTI